MYISSLIQAQILNATGITAVSNELRVAGDVLPAIVFEIDQDAKVECITNDPANWTYIANVRINILAVMLSSSLGLAVDVNNLFHGQVWSTSEAEVIQCNFIEQKSGAIDDGSPGLNDKSRVVTLSYQIIYKDL